MKPPSVGMVLCVTLAHAGNVAPRLVCTPCFSFKVTCTRAVHPLVTHFWSISVGLEVVVRIRRLSLSITAAETDCASCLPPGKIVPTASLSSVASACFRGMGNFSSSSLSTAAFRLESYFSFDVIGWGKGGAGGVTVREQVQRITRRGPTNPRCLHLGLLLLGFSLLLLPAQLFVFLAGLSMVRVAPPFVL